MAQPDAEDDDEASTAPGAPRDALSALPDDLLVRLLGTAPPQAIATLACVAKRYADVCERAGWACAARRFDRRTNAPFGGGAHWTALAWVPRDATRRPFDEGAFDATGAPPPADLADAFFWAEFFDSSDSSRNECLALQAVPRDGRVVRDPDEVLDDRAVGPEIVLTGSLKDAWRARHMAICRSVRILGALRSRVVVLYAWERPQYTAQCLPGSASGSWRESFDVENWDELIAATRSPFPDSPESVNWVNGDPDRATCLYATYGIDVPSPHAPDALFSIRGDYLVPEGAQRGTDYLVPASDLSIQLKVPMPVWGHVKPWRD